MKKTNLVQNGFSAGVIALLVSGCGQPSTNPIDSYSSLKKNSVPPYEEQVKPEATPAPIPPPIIIEAPKPQEFISTDVFQITPERDITFVEGVESTYKIRARVFVSGVAFALEAKNLPEGAKLSKSDSKDEPGTWNLSYKPQLGFIAPDKIERRHEYQVSLKILQTPDPKTAEILRQLNKDALFTFMVRRTQSPPALTLKNLPEAITEGSVHEFAVEVNDPASYPGFEPRVDFYFDGLGPNEKGFEGNGAVFVRPNPARLLPEKVGNGVWRYHLLFDTKSVPLAAQLDKRGDKPINSDGLSVRLSLKAYSKTGATSAETLVKRKILFSATTKAPIFGFDPSPETFKFISGQENHVSILVRVPDHRGTLTVEPGSVDWVGKPSIKCIKDSQDQSLQVCHLRWKTPCNAKDVYKLEIKAINTLIGEPKVSQFSQEIRVNKGAHCAAPGGQS